MCSLWCLQYKTQSVCSAPALSQWLLLWGSWFIYLFIYLLFILFSLFKMMKVLALCVLSSKYSWSLPFSLLLPCMQLLHLLSYWCFICWTINIIFLYSTTQVGTYVACVCVTTKGALLGFHSGVGLFCWCLLCPVVLSQLKALKPCLLLTSASGLHSVKTSSIFYFQTLNSIYLVWFHAVLLIWIAWPTVIWCTVFFFN